MSDNSIILCVDGIVSNNIKIASDIISYLRRNSVIGTQLTNCALGLGYSRADNYSSTVTFDEGMSLTTNGVKFMLEPAAYCSFELSPENVINCPSCGKDQFEDISVADFYQEKLTRQQLIPYNRISYALNNYRGTFTELACCHCDNKSEISEYNFNDRLTYSNLAMEFFNWGEFRPEFISQLETIIGDKVESYVMHY